MGASAKRRASRAHLQPTMRIVRDTSPRVVEDVRDYWDGRCACVAGNLHRFPSIYLLTVYEHRRKDSWRERRRKIRTGQTQPISIAYECLLESMYGLVRKAPHVGSFDTTESGSAEAIRWMENHFAAGVKVDLHQAQLESDSDAALDREVEMYMSLEAHLEAQGVTEAAKAERMRRFRDLLEMWPGDRNRLRLYQWLRYEFPGWIETQNDSNG